MFNQIAKRALLLVLASGISLTGCGKEERSYGWAGRIEGKTAISTVFVDDDLHRWEEEDEPLKGRMLDNLKIACDFLKENARVYGAETEFVYPAGTEGADDGLLMRDVRIEGSLLGDDPDSEKVDEFLLSEEVTKQRSDVLKKYRCDNIIYLFFLDTGLDNEYPSRSYMWMSPGDPEDEFSLIYTNVYGMETGPAVLAHEILHAFGAPDLYTSQQSGYEVTITEEFVQYLKEKGSVDIMYSVFDTDADGKKEMIYGRVGRDFSMLDAYYVGLVEDCSLVEEFGLGRSIYK